MMSANVLNRLLLVVAILALTVPRIVYSLSIYDVIILSQKGYEADDIIALIETTESAFDLTAKEVTRMKDAGVSEEVIQYLLAKSRQASLTYNQYKTPPVPYSYLGYYYGPSLYLGFGRGHHSILGHSRHHSNRSGGH